jgi:hemolysin III
MEFPAKPQLRGVFHQWAFFVALAAGATLAVLADGGRERVAVVVYASSLAGMFGASALYHRGPWRSAAVLAWMRRLDHSGIFLLIAGTYTPFALLVLDGRMATVLLVLVWAGAAAGLVLNLLWIDAPGWVAAGVYLALGWIGALAIPDLFSGAGTAWATLLMVGGGLYTLGAIAYALGRPNLWPGVFGFHELFHVLVIAAAAVQFIGVAGVVL